MVGVGVFLFGLERNCYVIGTTTVPRSFQLFSECMCHTIFAKHAFCQCCIIFHQLQTEYHICWAYVLSMLYYFSSVTDRIPYLLSICFVNVVLFFISYRQNTIFAEHMFCQCCIIFHQLQTELSSVFMKRLVWQLFPGFTLTGNFWCFTS